MPDDKPLFAWCNTCDDYTEHDDKGCKVCRRIAQRPRFGFVFALLVALALWAV